jgi:hypothetical protein
MRRTYEQCEEDVLAGLDGQVGGTPVPGPQEAHAQHVHLQQQKNPHQRISSKYDLRESWTFPLCTLICLVTVATPALLTGQASGQGPVQACMGV